MSAAGNDANVFPDGGELDCEQTPNRAGADHAYLHRQIPFLYLNDALIKGIPARSYADTGRQFSSQIKLAK